MARIVLLKDADPLVLKKEEMEGDVYVCRCGLSAKWPLCDSSHAYARKEQKGTTYRYLRQEPDGPLEQSVADEDPARSDPRPAGKPEETA